MKDENKIDFQAEIALVKPYDKYSFLQGFFSACCMFGVWRNGEQYLGIGDVTVSDVKRQLEKFHKLII